MSRRHHAAPAKRRAQAATGVAAPAAGLAVHEAAERAQALLRERAKLLREVQKKKLQLERVQQRLSQDAAAAVQVMAPLVQRHAALIQELTSLFAELLTPGRISARARKHVVQLRQLLVLQGVLTPLEDDGPEHTQEDPEAAPGSSASHARQRSTSSHRAGEPRAEQSAGPEVAGAEQVGQQRRSLRELFRSLAKAIHPDQARHDTDRQRRTEVMKEVTRAYEDGDLARLLELETSWQSEQLGSEQADSLARCQELERINRELLDQVRRLTRQIRDVKREAVEASLGLSPDALAEQARQELDEVEEICRFLEKFRDGRLSVTELGRGPRGLRQQDELELLEALFFSDDWQPAPSRPRRRRR